LVVVVHLVNSWLDVPGSLALAAVPTALAASLISLPAAVATAIGESLLLVVLLNYPTAELDLPPVVVALVAIWAVLGIVYTVHHPVRQLSGCLEEYFERAQYLLEEARDRRAELEQTLKSLAHANRQLALANERAAALRAIAEDARRAKTAFVAKVSHEFRTPLNMIIGLVDLMVETPEIYSVALSPEMRKDLRVVHRNCEHLSNMINDVLDLTRLEAGRVMLHKERADLREIIDNSVEAVRPLLEKKQLTLRIIIPSDLPRVYCDRTRIQQVILNLLSNATRFTEEGGITVEVGHQDQHIVVGVTDTGPGIAPQDAERIFEPFCQGAGELWHDKGGSGLGLSISKQFVKLHGGRMWLESKLGIGTSFSFTLPVSPLMEHIAEPRHWIREDWTWQERTFRTDQAVSTDQLIKPRVVVCDETGTLYPEFMHYSDKVEFIDTRNLAQATRELQQCPAHAVVLNTPVSDNPRSLIERVKQEAPGTPIVGCSVPRPVERALNAGALGYLIKPVTRAGLEKAIQALGKPVKRVLVVDDDPDVLQLFSRMLYVCDSTLEIATASSGEEALDELRHTSPDLMLLDIVMPDMDGWQLLELMTQDEKIGNVPTFFVSAQDPADQPPLSRFLLATMDEGLSLSKLLRCSLEISALLLAPEEGLDLAPV
jgi:signal transduction histidine kinase/CheY-like chemotaxis protein